MSDASVPKLSLDDLEHDAPVRARAAGSDDRAERPGDPALAADHLADVIRRDPQLKHGRAFLSYFLDRNRIRIVDELAREVLEELSHRRRPS